MKTVGVPRVRHVGVAPGMHLAQQPQRAALVPVLPHRLRLQLQQHHARRRRVVAEHQVLHMARGWREHTMLNLSDTLFNELLAGNHSLDANVLEGRPAEVMEVSPETYEVTGHAHHLSHPVTDTLAARTTRF